MRRVLGPMFQEYARVGRSMKGVKRSDLQQSHQIQALATALGPTPNWAEKPRLKLATDW